MYDVDGNGVIDQDEMSKIIQVVMIFNRKNKKMIFFHFYEIF